MKVCSQCNTEKDESHFYRNKKNGYFPYCKGCAKKNYAEKHYQSNKDLYKERSIKSIKQHKEWYFELKSSLKCSCCGESRHWCLAFHHTEPSKKETTVSSLVRMNSKKKIEDEIAKCIVLCHNCHADLHYKERLEVV